MLIVDDEPFNLIALEGLIGLIDPNIRIERAFTGKEALDKIILKKDGNTSCQSHKPLRLVITDNNMPVMTGIELALNVRALNHQLPRVSTPTHIALLSGD